MNNKPTSIWLEAIEWFQRMDRVLPAVFPPELPDEHSQGFWYQVARVEMANRVQLSNKIRSLIRDKGIAEMTPLDSWLYRRRVEWAAQVCLVRVAAKVEPNVHFVEVLEWLLIASWDSDGCIGLWNHAERDGKPHPENPDGMLRSLLTEIKNARGE